jgi:hypothetical protein
MKESRLRPALFCIERVLNLSFWPDCGSPVVLGQQENQPGDGYVNSADQSQHANENERGERCSRSSERPAGIHHDQSEHQTCPERRAHG